MNNHKDNTNTIKPMNGNRAFTPVNNFDALRLIGALLVLLSHMAALSGRHEWRFVGDHSFGNLGVLIFFSISGYLVTASWGHDPNIARFAARRSLRLVPGLLAAFLMSWAVVNALGLSGFPNNPLHTLNGSLWTIPIEAVCYLILLAVAAFTSRFGLPLALLILLLYLNPTNPFTHFVGYFGMFFAVGALLKAYPVLQSMRSTVTLCIVGALFVFKVDDCIGLAMIVPPLAVYVGTRSWPILKSAGRFGDLSYGIYLYAWPMQQITVATLGPSSSYFVLLLPALLMSVSAAWLSWRYVEKPALFLKPKHYGNAATMSEIASTSPSLSAAS